MPGRVRGIGSVEILHRVAQVVLGMGRLYV
jgi:hypothetical protein